MLSAWVWAQLSFPKTRTANQVTISQHHTPLVGVLHPWVVVAVLNVFVVNEVLHALPNPGHVSCPERPAYCRDLWVTWIIG